MLFTSPEFVYVLAPGQIMPDDKAYGILWLNRSLMEAAYDMNGAFNDISLTLSPTASEPQVLRRLDLLLARFGGTAAYGRDDQTSHAYISQELDQLRTIAMVIPPMNPLPVKSKLTPPANSSGGWLSK